MDAGGGALDGARMHVSSVQVEHGSDDLDLEWLSSTTLGPCMEVIARMVWKDWGSL